MLKALNKNILLKKGTEKFMLNIINESLFNFDTMRGTNDYGEYYKLSVNSTSKAVKIMNDNSVVPITRPIIRLVSPDKDYSNYNLNVSTRENDRHNINVLVKADKRNTHNANVFVIAFPFNGIVKPIPENKQYRIYKGFINISDKMSINFNNKKYRKILYMVIEPNMNLFNEDHKYHTDKIELNLESFTYINRNSKDDTQDFTPYTDYEAMKLVITKNTYSVQWDSKKMDNLVDMSRFKGQPLWVTYRKPQMNNNGSSTSNTTRESNNTTMKENATITDNTSEGKNMPSKKYDTTMRRAFTNAERKYANYEEEDDEKPAKRHGNKGKKSKKKYR